MNRPTESWERATTDALDERVSGLDAHPFDLDSVRGRARGIRRTRRLAAAGGTLAAAAVLVPLALLGADDLSRTDSPPIATTPSESPSRADDAEDAGGTEDASPPRAVETEPGTALGFAWISGRTLTSADGTTLRLPEAFGSATALDDAVLASRTLDSGDAVVSVVDAAGETRSGTVAASPIVATNTEHTVGAFAGLDDGLFVVGPDGDSERLNPEGTVLGAGVIPVAVTGTCAPRSAGGEAPVDPDSTGTCRVFFDDGSFEPGAAQVIGPDGDVADVDPAIRRLVDVAEEGAVVAGQTESSDDGSCSAVRRDGAEVWSTCDYSFLGFSPDGAYLAATDAYRDGFGQAWVAILDAGTGQEVARHEMDTPGLTQPVWVGDTELVLPGYGADGWTLTTLGTDGVSAVVARTSAGDDLTPGFVVLGEG